MAAEKGWIKLYRDILGHWVYEDPLALKVWVTLLCMANHESRKILLNNETLDIRRGQLWTSIRKLSIVTGMTRKTVEIKLKLLQSDGMIFVDAKRGLGTLISVRNYGDYQDFSHGDGDTQGYTQGDTQGDKVETPRGTHSTHKQELNNYKHYEALKNNGLAPDDPDYFEEV